MEVLLQNHTYREVGRSVVGGDVEMYEAVDKKKTSSDREQCLSSNLLSYLQPLHIDRGDQWPRQMRSHPTSFSRQRSFHLRMRGCQRRQPVSCDDCCPRELVSQRRQ